MPQEAVPEETHPGRFARVECSDCGNEQVVFARAAMTITCQVCGTPMAEPTGGVVRYVGSLVEYIE